MKCPTEGCGKEVSVVTNKKKQTIWKCEKANGGCGAWGNVPKKAGATGGQQDPQAEPTPAPAPTPKPAANPKPAEPASGGDVLGTITSGLRKFFCLE